MFEALKQLKETLTDKWDGVHYRTRSFIVFWAFIIFIVYSILHIYSSLSIVVFDANGNVLKDVRTLVTDQPEKYQ